MSKGISFITPTYNNSQEFEAMLKSFLIVQIEPPFEILVMDDSENTQINKIYDKYKYQLPLKYFKTKRQFIGQKRNFGASKARYELIIFIDSDLTFEQDAFKKITESMKKHPDIAMFSGTIIQDGKQLHPTAHDRQITKDDISLVEIIYSAYVATYKSIFTDCGGYDKIFENRGEGTDLSIKYWRQGYPLARNLQSKVYHPTFNNQRKSPERIAEMYRSLYLVGYKYGLDPQKNIHFSEMYKERQDAYGEKLEFYCIYAASFYIDWFGKNYRKLYQSKAKALKNTIYDFKPFDIFTDSDLLNKCLNSSQSRINSAYKKAWC